MNNVQRSEERTSFASFNFAREQFAFVVVSYFHLNMSDDLQDFDEELTKLCAEIQKGIDALPKAANKTEQVSFLNGRITRAKQVFSSYKVEMRDLSKTEAEPWQRKAKEHHQKINDLVQNLSWAQEKAELMRGKKDPPKEKAVDEMTADEIIEKGAKIQRNDLKSLDRTLQTIDDTKAVAADTAAKLKEQTDALKRIDEGVNEVEANLKMAEKQLRAFVRRMATDKIIMAFIVLIIIGIIIVIVVSIVKPNSNTNVPDSFKP